VCSYVDGEVLVCILDGGWKLRFTFKSLFGYDGSVPFGDRFHCKRVFFPF